jgi:hypothetical protein
VPSLRAKRSNLAQVCLSPIRQRPRSSAAPYVKEKLGGRIGIGAQVRGVQAIFTRIFNPEPGFVTDGSVEVPPGPRGWFLIRR